LTAQQRFAMQFVENAQRENVSALEEARAIVKQLAERQAVNPEFSLDDLAKEVGISRASAYELRKLTRLHPETEKALVDGKISASVASEVAKLPTPAAQKELLKIITNEQNWQWPYSVRDVQKLIDEKFIKQLAAAVFDVKLTYGDSVTGIMAPCAGCPHRSGNMLVEFPDLKSKPNVCTKVDCFEAKTQAAWKTKRADLELEGIKTMTDEERKKKSDEFVQASETCYRSAGYKSYGTLMGKHKPKPVVVLTDEGLKEFYPKQAVMEAIKENGIKLEGGGGGDAAERKKQAAYQKKKKEYQGIAQDACPQILKGVIDGKEPSLPLAVWKLLAQAVYETTDITRHDFVAQGRGWSTEVTESRNAVQKWLKAEHTAREYAEFVVELMICARWNGGGWHAVAWDKDFLALCKLAGGTPEKLAELTQKAEEKGGFWDDEKPRVTQVQPTLLKLPAVKTNGKKFKMSPANKAKIAAAAKARWTKIKAAKKG
jgi:ParB-like chromosome segregation protein Spo0J